MQKFILQSARKRLSNLIWGCQQSPCSSSSLKSESVWIFCTGCEEHLLVCWRQMLEVAESRRPVWRRNTLTKHFPRFHNTVLQYRVTVVTRLGGARLKSDSEGLTWQVRGTGGGASSTELYVESHKTLTHPWDEVSSVSGGQRRSRGTRLNTLSFTSLILQWFAELFWGHKGKVISQVSSKQVSSLKSSQGCGRPERNTAESGEKC